MTTKQIGLISTLVFSAIKQLATAGTSSVTRMRNLFYDIYNFPFQHLPSRKEERFFLSSAFNERLVNQILSIYYSNLKKLKFAKESEAQTIFYNGASYDDNQKRWLTSRLPYQIVTIVSRSVNLPGYNLQEKEFIVMAVLYMLRVLTGHVSTSTATYKYFKNNGIMLRNAKREFDKNVPMVFLNPSLKDLQNNVKPAPAVVTTVQADDPNNTIIQPEPNVQPAQVQKSGGLPILPIAIAYYIFNAL